MRMLRWFTNFDKEERWLNQMAAQGYHFTHKEALGLYVFVEGAPCEQNYRIDFRHFSNKKDYQDYINLFEDSGWRFVYGKRSEGVQYFVPKLGMDADDIFSDALSKAGRYNRLAQQYMTLSIPFISLFIVLYTTGNFKYLGFEYYTPGLWEKTGLSFIWSFLFETPFVIMRGTLPFIPILLLAPFLLFAVKAKLKYKSALQESKL